MRISDWSSDVCSSDLFEAKPPELSAYFCHCRMCQRAVGNIFASFVNLPKADVRWTTREPDYYASTMFARRGFCSACGTPLTFDYPDSDVIDQIGRASCRGRVCQ